jgi:hypothetical protein
MRPDMQHVDLPNGLQFTYPARLAHRLPGRVRLRLEPADVPNGRRLAARLRSHPSVSSAVWSEPNRSLTVQFDPTLCLPELFDSLPAKSSRAPRETDSAGLDWGRIALACLLSLLPLGPIGGLGLTLATEIAAGGRAASHR